MLKKFENDYSAALECFQKAINIGPNPLFYFYKGETYYMLDDYSKAIECFTQSIKLDATNAAFHHSKATALMEMYYESEESDEDFLSSAINCFEKAIELNPNLEGYLTDLGNAYYLNKNMSKANVCYKKAIELNPENAEAHNGCGQVLNDKKGFKNDYKKAIAFYSKAIEIDPKNATYQRNKGIAYFCLKDFESAIECYNTAIKLDPAEAQYHFYKGESLKALRKYELAKKEYVKAIELRPNYVEAKKSLSLIRQKIRSQSNIEESPVKSASPVKAFVTDDVMSKTPKRKLSYFRNLSSSKSKKRLILESD